MQDELGIGEALHGDVTVATIVARHLGLKSNFFSHNRKSKKLNRNFKVLNINGVVHLRIPRDLKRYIADYHATVLGTEDSEKEFDYVVELNKNKKIGFWR